MRYVCTRARVQSLTESVRARTRTQGRSGLHARTACEVRSLGCVSFTVGSLFQGRRVHILVRHAGAEAGKVCSVRVHGGGARASVCTWSQSSQVSHVGQRWEARARLPFCTHGLDNARRTRTRRVSLVCRPCGVAVVFVGFVGTVFYRVRSY